MIGLYALHRLSMIQEKGHVQEKLVAQELFVDVRSQIRTLSSVESVKQMLSFPVLMVKDITVKIISNGNKKKNQ